MNTEGIAITDAKPSGLTIKIQLKLQYSTFIIGLLLLLTESKEHTTLKSNQNHKNKLKGDLMVELESVE